MTNKQNPLRYLRHIDLPQLGFEGQERIMQGAVLLVGMGGLGAPAALYLAGAGVGRLGLIDSDVVDESNLQRQVLYREADVGTPKIVAAEKHLAALNNSINIDAHHLRLDEKNAAALVQDYDVVLDCSDNFKTRYLLNAVCVSLKKPLVSASVQGFAGQLGVFRGYEKNHACYRCLFPDEPVEGLVPTCPEAGVFGPIVGIMGVMQAGEALKELAGLNTENETRFINIDAFTLSQAILTLEKNQSCKTCSHNPSSQ